MDVVDCMVGPPGTPRYTVTSGLCISNKLFQPTLHHFHRATPTAHTMPAKHLLLTLLCLATTHAEMITVETDPMYILPEANYSFSFDVPDSHTLLSRLYVVSLTTNFTCSAVPSVVVLLDTVTYAADLPYNSSQWPFFIGVNMTDENVQAVVTMENCASFVKVVAEFYHVDDEMTIVHSGAELIRGDEGTYFDVKIPFNATYMSKTTARLLHAVNCFLPLYADITIRIGHTQYTLETEVDVGDTLSLDQGHLVSLGSFDREMTFQVWVGNMYATRSCVANFDVELIMHHVDIPATSVPSTAAPWTNIPFPPPYVFTPTPSDFHVDWNFLVLCVVAVVGICVAIMIYLFYQRRRAPSSHPVVAVPGVVVDTAVQGVCVDDTPVDTERSALLQRG